MKKPNNQLSICKHIHGTASYTDNLEEVIKKNSDDKWGKTRF